MYKNYRNLAKVPLIATATLFVIISGLVLYSSKKVIPEHQTDWGVYNVKSCGKLLLDPQISFSIPPSWEVSFSEKDYVAQYIITGKDGEKLTLTCGDGLGGGCDNWGEIKLGDKTFPACPWERDGVIHISNIGGSSNTIGFDLHVEYPEDN